MWCHFYFTACNVYIVPSSYLPSFQSKTTLNHVIKDYSKFDGDNILTRVYQSLAPCSSSSCCKFLQYVAS